MVAVVQRGMMVTWSRVVASLLQPLLPPHRILNGSGLAPPPHSPSVVHRSTHLLSPDNPKAGMLSCKWTGRNLAPVHQPHLTAQTSVSLVECPTEALTRHMKRSNRLPQLFPKETSSQNL